MSEILDASLAYARRGWPVLPLHSITAEGGCTCGSLDCGSPGKHPRTKNGLADATTDAGLISWWLAKWPEANVAILMGAASGLVALDDDPRHGGDDSLAELERQSGPLPHTVQSVTGGGGRHLLFAHPGNGSVIHPAVALLPGIDLRGDGSYIVAPPSLHASGRRYEWELSAHPDDAPFAPMPPVLLDLIERSRRRGAEPRGDGERIPEGQRNPHLASLAGSMRRPGMTGTEIEAALLAVNRERCEPPLDEREVRQIAQSVARYEPAAAAKVCDALRMGSASERNGLPFRTARELSELTPPRTDFLLDGYLARGAITELVGKVKASGKTTLALAWCRAIIEGRPFAGREAKQGRVVYLTEQSDRTFRDALRRAGLEHEEHLTVLYWHEARGVPWPQIVERTIEECRAREAALLVVDTIGQWAGLRGDSENNAGDALGAIEPLQVAAAAHDLAVLAARHARKGGGDVGDDGRGSTAFAGAVDVVLSLRRPENSTDPAVRVLHALSRFDATPDTLAIQLVGSSYVALGDEAAYAFEIAKRQVLDAAPRTEEHALPESELLDAAKVRRTSGREAVAALRELGSLRRVGAGKKNDAFRYWCPEEMVSDADKDLRASERNDPSRKVVPERERESTEGRSGAGTGNDDDPMLAAAVASGTVAPEDAP